MGRVIMPVIAMMQRVPKLLQRPPRKQAFVLAAASASRDERPIKP